jgi:hypothetical protein
MEKVVEKCLELVQKCWKWSCDIGKAVVGTTHNRESHRRYNIPLLMTKGLSCSFLQKSKDLHSAFHFAARHLSPNESSARPSPMFIVPGRPEGRISPGPRHHNVREAATVSHDLEGTYGCHACQGLPSQSSPGYNCP